MERNLKKVHRSYAGSNNFFDVSNGSTNAEEETMELIKAVGVKLKIPQKLCEDYSLFKQILSLKTWEGLDDVHKEELKRYLPQFSENDEEEKEKTIRKLFGNEEFHFSSPLLDFYKELHAGNYRPDIAKARKVLKKVRVKECNHKTQNYFGTLIPDMMLARERLLTAVSSLPPDPIPKIPKILQIPSIESEYDRVKEKVLKELKSIQFKIVGGEAQDENHPEIPPPQRLPKKRKRGTLSEPMDENVFGTLGSVDPVPSLSEESLKKYLGIHKERRHKGENHPELNIIGLKMDDIKKELKVNEGPKKAKHTKNNRHKPETPLQKLKKSIQKESYQRQTRTNNKKSRKRKQDNVENEHQSLIGAKRKRQDVDYKTPFLDPVPTLQYNRKLKDNGAMKREYQAKKNFNYESQLPSTSKFEPFDSLLPIQSNSRTKQPIPIKLEDLDGIDMMTLPVELADESGDILPFESRATNEKLSNAYEALTETTYANFLSLVRALFPARSAHRASKEQLHARCAAVMRSPIAPINKWYNLSPDWCAELNSALDFLAGERGPHPDDFVPYLQYLPESRMYQWIGAGRDCDTILGRLCERWLRSVSPTQSTSDVPPSRYQTAWVVRSPTAEEIEEFQAQERERFSSASKPFTYVQHGYRSVVGPCRQAAGRNAGGSLLLSQRPRIATFASLLRDAIARLPNGEGTKQDIITLLRMSQWIKNNCSEQGLINAVSTGLDKLLAAKRDPYVKYDPRTALWTYLDRHKGEEDWTGGGQSEDYARIFVAKALAHSSPRKFNDMGAITDEVDGSNSDVDVDNVDASPTSHLSSAQLLMQATQASQAQKFKQTTVNKPKENIVSTIPKYRYANAKHTPQIKQENVKQSNRKKSRSNTNKSKQIIEYSNVNDNQKQNNTNNTKNILETPKTTPAKPSLKQSLVKSTVGDIMKNSISLNQANEETKKLLPTIVVAPCRSPLVKQQSIQKIETTHTITSACVPSRAATVLSLTPSSSKAVHQEQTKWPQVTRSLLIRPPLSTSSAPTITVCALSPQPAGVRRGVVRVISPATSSAKSLISPLALMPHSIPMTMKSIPVTNIVSVTTVAQSAANMTSVVSSVSTAVACSVASRSEQVTGGRSTPANQMFFLTPSESVHVTQKPAVQLQLQTHTVRLSNGQTVQIVPPKIQAVRALPTEQVRFASPAVPPRPTITMKPPQRANKPIHIPVSSVKTPGQTLQIGSQTVQMSRQTLKLSTQKVVQVLNQNTLQSQTFYPSNTIPLAGGNVQTAQMNEQNVQAAGVKNVQMARTQNIQLASAQNIQMATRQNIQAQGGHSVQLGKNIQLCSGQNVQLTRASNSQLVNEQKVQLFKEQNMQLTCGTNIQMGSRQIVQLTRGPNGQLASEQSVQLVQEQKMQLTSRKNIQLCSGQNVQLVRTPNIQPASEPNAQIINEKTMQLSSGNNLKLASGPIVQLTRGSNGQLASVKNTRLNNEQNVQLTTRKSIQLGSVQNVQLTYGSNVQATNEQNAQSANDQYVQLTSEKNTLLGSGQNTLLGSGQNTLLGSGQNTLLGSRQNVPVSSPTIQIGRQTVQWTAQSIKLPNGQTLQLRNRQTTQITGGQPIQLASGQILQLAHQQNLNSISQVVRPQTPSDKPANQIVSKLLTNVQGQPISLENMVARARTPQVAPVGEIGAVRPRAAVNIPRVSRPLLLTSKTMQNLILQRGSTSISGATSSGVASTTQTVVVSNIVPPAVTTTTATTPVIKLQQVNPIRHIRLPQRAKIIQVVPSSTVPTSSGVRSVLLEGQQLKFVDGRHVVARIIRPNTPQQ